MATRTKKKIGFALLSKEKRRAMARKGGIAAHAAGRGHKFTSAEGKRAGLKGGGRPRKGK